MIYQYAKRHAFLLLLLLITLPFLLIRLPQSPHPWYDEGINLLAVRSLAETGRYGLPAASGLRVSDPAIQSGPPLLLILTLLQKLFGGHIGLMRLVSVVFGLLALVTLYALATRLYNRFTGFLTVFLMLIMPVFDTTAHVIPMSRQVLGEMPAIFLVALGLLLMANDSGRWWYPVLAGLCFGLAVSIKSQVLLILTATIGLWLLYGLVRQRRIMWPWVVIGLVVMGIYGMDTFWRTSVVGERRPEMGTILLEGIYIHLLPVRGLKNLESLSALWIVGIAVIAVVGVLHWRRTHNVHSSDNTRLQVESFLLLFIGVWMIWYSFMSIGWLRYAFVGHVFSLILFAAFVARVWKQRRPSITPKVYAGATVTAGVLMLMFQLPMLLDDTGDSFFDTVQYLRQDVSPDAVIVSWDLPIAYLAAQPFEFPTTDVTNAITASVFDIETLDYRYKPAVPCPNYLLYGSFSVDRQVIKLPVGKPVFQEGSYILYPVSEACQTSGGALP